MEVPNYLKTEDEWLLAIMDLIPYVEGRTRLQKFGTLCFYEVLSDEEFFDDWRPDRYGGFSPRLAASLAKLEMHGCIQSDEVITQQGHPVSRYTLTRKGKDLISDFAKWHSPELKRIGSIILDYFQQPLMALLRDVYQRYPKLTANSEIRAGVNKAAGGHRYQDSEPTTGMQEKLREAPASTTASQQHVFGDEDFREKLARSAGLEGIPDLDPRSFDRIKGVLSGQISTEGFDSEEMVKEVRGC